MHCGDGVYLKLSNASYVGIYCFVLEVLFGIVVIVYLPFASSSRLLCPFVNFVHWPGQVKHVHIWYSPLEIIMYMYLAHMADRKQFSFMARQCEYTIARVSVSMCVFHSLLLFCCT